MGSKMLIDASHPEETRVVVLKGNRIEEFDFESAARRQLKGNIYLAKVTRVEPSLQAAFIEYGGNRHGFLAFSEIHPDYYQIPLADRRRCSRPRKKNTPAKTRTTTRTRATASAAQRRGRDRDRGRRPRPRRLRGGQLRGRQWRARTAEQASARRSDDDDTSRGEIIRIDEYALRGARRQPEGTTRPRMTSDDDDDDDETPTTTAARRAPSRWPPPMTTRRSPSPSRPRPTAGEPEDHAEADARGASSRPRPSRPAPSTRARHAGRTRQWRRGSGRGPGSGPRRIDRRRRRDGGSAAAPPQGAAPPVQDPGSDQAPPGDPGAGRQGRARQQGCGAHHLSLARRPLLRADAEHRARRRHLAQDHRTPATAAASRKWRRKSRCRRAWA